MCIINVVTLQIYILSRGSHLITSLPYYRIHGHFIGNLLKNIGFTILELSSLRKTVFVNNCKIPDFIRLYMTLFQSYKS